jgi:hypothetical protein
MVIYKIAATSGAVAAVALMITVLNGCRKFDAGDCIQHVNDGFIWRIVEVRSGKYVMQAWQDAKWGVPVEGSTEYEDGRYVKISCPFGTETIR